MSMQFRQISYLPIRANSLKEVEMVVPLRAENIVLFRKEEYRQSRFRYWDLGRFCFTKRASKKSLNPSSGAKEFTVGLSSFKVERRFFVERAAHYVRETQSSERTLESLAAKVMRFFLFLEKMDYKHWPHNEENALHCYDKYVEGLLHRSRLPRNKEAAMSPNSAAAIGKVARDLIASVYEVDLREIERKIPSLEFTGSAHREDPKSKSDRQTFVQVCMSIFEQFHAAILDRKPFPWRIDLKNAGINQTFFWGGRQSLKTMYDDYFYKPSGEIVTLDELLASLDSDGFEKGNDIVKVNGIGNSNRSSVIAWFKERDRRWKEINNDIGVYNGLLFTSYEFATRCFFFCFLAATALNYSVAARLIHGSEDYIPERGYVFLGLKVRAGNKVVHATFKKNFEKFFKKFKELRSWAVSQLEIEPPLWFFLFEHPDFNDGKLGMQRLTGARQIAKDGFRKLPSGTFKSLDSIFEKYDLSVYSIGPKELRQGVSFDWYRLSGNDAKATSIKLQNNVETVQKSYSEVNAEDAYPEMLDYYGKVFERVKSVGRSAPGSIPVRVIQDDHGSDNLPVGNCDNVSFVKPTKAAQFTEDAPDPDCARSETCLFCEFFALHADRPGLKKLLSFRELFPLIKERTGSIDRYIEVFSPIEGRIDEILEYIKETYPDKASLLKEVATEVSEGELDEFWEHHFNFLIELGYAG